jgi:hypothetical protein
MQKTARLLLVSITCLLAGCYPHGYRKAAAACRQVHAGMTEAQVLKIMGEPKARNEPRTHPGDLWLRYYEGGDLAPIIVILIKSGDKYVVDQDGGCAA